MFPPKALSTLVLLSSPKNRLGKLPIPSILILDYCIVPNVHLLNKLFIDGNIIFLLESESDVPKLTTIWGEDLYFILIEGL